MLCEHGPGFEGIFDINGPPAAGDMVHEYPPLRPSPLLAVLTLPCSWETAEPGRAARAALLWTQRQASKVKIERQQRDKQTILWKYKPGVFIPYAM